MIGGLVGFLVWLLNRFEISLVESLYLLPATLAAYFFLVLLFRAMTLQDVRFIIRTLKPSSTKRYLVEEFQGAESNEPTAD